MNTLASSFFVTGGTLRHDAPCYLERRADAELLNGLLRGEFCYVLTSRQMGKSSLMVRTAQRLREQGIKVVVLDLTAIGLNLTPEQWYDGLLLGIGRQLDLEDQMDGFWRNHERLGPVNRFFSAVREVAVNQQSNSRLVIFVDEIDTVRSLPFVTDEFFAAIQECYNRRTEDPACAQLAFCFLGVATPAELMRDMRLTPFNIGRRIELTDFTAAEAMPLAAGLGKSPSAVCHASYLLARILYWTNGHPYLTQRLCRAIAETDASLLNTKSKNECRKLVDSHCGELFLANRARERDDNLLFVRERLLRSQADTANLLRLYDRVLQQRCVRDDDTDPLFGHLRLAGVTRALDGRLSVRNRIYQRVFDRQWVKSSLESLRRRDAKSVAVLPFANLNPDLTDEYLCDGLTEDLITALSQVKGLRVPSRSSAFVFKGKIGDVRKIGETLGVMTVLEGSVRKAEKKLRVNTQLVNVADGFQLWSGKYEREMAELFVIQDEITCAIVEVLKVRLIGEAGKSLIKHYTANTDAYHLYLKGRYYWNQRGLGLQKGMHYFELALLEDPNYALAHSGLADTFALLGFYGYWPNREAFPKAKAAALKALEIDEALAEAHTSLGLVFFLHDWDFVRAEQEYKRAIALNPNYAPARYWHAWFLSALNRMDEALAEDLLAIEIDPLSVYAITQLGWMRYHARQFDQAAADFRKALQLESNSLTAHWLLGKTMLCQSKFPEALAALEKAARLSGQSSWMTAWLGFGYGMAGKSDAAQQVLLSLQEKSQHAYVPPFLFAIVFTGLGDNDQAFAWLQKARQEREEWFVWLPVEPAFDPLRSDPRFSEMLAACQLGST